MSRYRIMSYDRNESGELEAFNWISCGANSVSEAMSDFNKFAGMSSHDYYELYHEGEK